jgi:putative copper export protein
MADTFLPIVQRMLLFGGVLFLVGIGAWRSWIFPRLSLDPPVGDGPEPPPLGGRVARLGVATILLVLLPAWGLRLYSQLLDFRDPFAPLSEDLSFLVWETFWGTVWIAQGVVLLGLVPLFLLLRRRGGGSGPLPRLWKLTWGGIILLLLTLSLSSHAMSVPYNRPLAVAVDATHTAAAGAWIGSLALILLLHGPGWGIRMKGARPEGDGALFAAQLRAFSPVAMVSVGVLVFMGLVLSSVHIGEFRNLWASSYGRVLSLKILLAGGVMLLGAVNWRRGLPVLDSESGRRAVHRRAGLEVLLALAVLAATAVLVGTTMPEGVH